MQIPTVSMTVNFVTLAREMVEAERSLEQEDPGTFSWFLLMTFGTWIVYTVMYEFVRSRCTCRGRHWCHPKSSEAAEPRVQVEKKVPPDGPANEPGASCAIAPAALTFERGVKGDALPAQIFFTDGGDKCHTSQSCTGLNARVYRIRKREVCTVCCRKND